MHVFLGVIVDESSQQEGWLTGGGWFVLALVNAGLAEQKNRSRLAWFLISLLLGPFATFLIVVMAPAIDEQAKPLHPFSTAERYIVVACFAMVLTVSAVLISLAGQAWYMWLASGIFAVLCVLFSVLLAQARAKSRLERTPVHTE